MNEIAEAGFRDVLVGTELYRALDIPTYELSAEPAKFAKFKQIADFLNTHPDPLWVINRVKNNRSGLTNLDYLSNYASLNTRLMSLTAETNKVKKDLEFYG